ncbi:hypothetical protein EYF80_030217 [Liparis tanakae]|uniref:Uncharacterized protein n=1 Tax=Liparis tanakae TaxID=230148 RepID=A0A4Z2H118_9TELE|nr:hypothetical protein EYF80_030217 [Liparis tanakae]
MFSRDEESISISVSAPEEILRIFTASVDVHRRGAGSKSRTDNKAERQPFGSGAECPRYFGSTFFQMDAEAPLSRSHFSRMLNKYILGLQSTLIDMNMLFACSGKGNSSTFPWRNDGYDPVVISSCLCYAAIG